MDGVASENEFFKTKFDPQTHPDNTLEAFQEYIKEYRYIYEARAKEPPNNLSPEEKTAWIETDKRRMFLGKYASRNLQKELEEVTTEAERGNLTFAGLVDKLIERFKLSSNTTLSNYKFRKLTQASTETFDMFVIRVKQQSRQCNFSCNAEACTVKDTMVRDQIVFGTKDDEIRRQALHEQWDLATLIKKGRSLEAATHGATEIIKSENGIKIKQEGEYSGIGRTKPKKYSRKYNQNTKSKREERNLPPRKNQCDTCTSKYCKGKKCAGKEVTCFACNRRGHFKGASACKKSNYTRRIEESDSETNSETEYSTDESTQPESSSEEETRRKTIRRIKKGRPITVVRRVRSGKNSENGSPFSNEILSLNRARMTQNTKEGRYKVNVTIRGKTTKVFADTGADICIMSYATAKKLKLPLQNTNMKIRPYGSSTKSCKGCYTGSVMHGDAVTNATIYIINRKVETLLSGKVCEQLGIIKFNKSNIANVEAIDKDKQDLQGKFPNLFQGVGKLNNYQVHFHVDDDIKPVCQPKRPTPFHLKSKFDRAVDELETEDIIEEHVGPSPWVSNVVLAPKDDGGVRVTVDMREPNKAIKPTRQPITRPEEIKAQLSPYRVFSKLDFKSAFHQLELDEQSRQLTVFHAGDRLMRFKRLTMGATPASGELSRALRPILSNCKGTYVIHDDVIVAGRNKKEHDKNLAEVCRIIEQSGMTLNLEKCLIGKSEIPWWGMRISDKGVTPDPEKVKALRHASPPTSKDEVISFLCMAQSNKDFIPNLSSKTVYLRQLTKKHARFIWTEQCKREFEELCMALKNDTLLRYYNPTKQTFIFVDAHKTGIAAILAQGKNEEDAKPVSYASRATTDVERRYPQIDLEALAVDYGLRRYRFFLVGSPEITVCTDHKPLEAVFNNNRKGSIRTERIKLRHQDIRYKVIWKKGKNNQADYLSRHATPRSKTSMAEKEESKELEKTVWYINYGPYTEAVSMEKIIQATREDHILKQLKQAIKKGYINKKDKQLAPYSKVFDEIMISDEGLLLKGEKIILPQKLIGRALRKAHQGAHPGMSGMKRRIRAHFWYPKMDTIIEEFVENCKECTIFTNKKTQDLLHPHQRQGHKIWDTIHVDLFGPMPDAKHVLVATDNVSRFPAAEIVPGTSAKPVIKALDKIYTNFGQPSSHRTDNGPPFNSKEFEDYSKRKGITHIKTFPYHPQANPAETFMKPLGKTMKIAHHKNKDKQVALNELLTSYRSTPHSATGLSPGGVMLRGGYSTELPQTNPIVTDQKIRKAMDLEYKERQDRASKINSSKYRKTGKFAIGDKVYTRNNKATKFQPIFDPTPRTITDMAYGGIICTAEDGTIQRRHTNDVKEAIEERELQAASIPLPEEEELEIQESDTEILREEAPENTSVQTTSHSRKSDRRTKPPSRYTDDSFETSLRPGK